MVKGNPKSMIGEIWNIRGTGKPGQKQALADFIRNHKLEFIGIQETKKMVFTSQFVNFISGPVDFSWVVLAAKRTAGGILVGFKNDCFEVINHTCLEYCVVVTIKNKIDKFIWQLVVVYGTPYLEFKLEFIVELYDVMEQNFVPTLLGSDFNLVRTASD